MFCFQLILPECMKLLPLYTNCILKNDILLGGKSSSSLHRDMNFWVLQSPKLLVFLHDVWKFIVSKFDIRGARQSCLIMDYINFCGKVLYRGNT